MLLIRRLRFTPLLACVFLTACGGSSSDAIDDEPLDDPNNAIPSEGAVYQVSIDGVQGEYLEGAPPEAVGSIVIESLSNDQRDLALVSGGSVEVPLATDADFTTVYVVPDSDGYFAIHLGEATHTAPLIISGREDLGTESDLELSVQVETPFGSISQPASLVLTPLSVGTGDLQVSVSWDTPTDVDLFLVEPSGREISFVNGLSDTGGQLDLDSNSDCEIDGFNNENITYEGASPAAGEYVAGVSYYSDCGIESPTNFVVTVRANGTTEIYTGQLVPGDSGGESTVEVARFSVQ